jgi:hypothetical protein
MGDANALNRNDHLLTPSLITGIFVKKFHAGASVMRRRRTGLTLIATQRPLCQQVCSVRYASKYAASGAVDAKGTPVRNQCRH